MFLRKLSGLLVFNLKTAGNSIGRGNNTVKKEEVVEIIWAAQCINTLSATVELSAPALFELGVSCALAAP